MSVREKGKNWLIERARKLCSRDRDAEEKSGIEQCFSTGGPKRSLSGSPNFSHFVSNHYFIHNYYKFDKKPTLLAT